MCDSFFNLLQVELLIRKITPNANLIYCLSDTNSQQIISLSAINIMNQNYLLWLV